MVDLLLRYYIHEPRIQDSRGTTAITVLEHHLREKVHKDDVPFEIEYFRAITKHKFDKSSVAQHFQRKFIDKRNGIYYNIYLLLRGIETRVEVRRGASKLIPGNEGILNAPVDCKGAFHQKFMYPNSIEHTFTNSSGSTHRGVFEILHEYKNTDNYM